MPIRDEETLRSALQRHLGGTAVIDVASSVLNEGTRGLDRDEALGELANRLSAATGLVVTAEGETLTVSSEGRVASCAILPDQYSALSVAGGIVEISRALNTALAQVGSPIRGWIFWSSDEVGGICLASPDAVESLLGAVDGRYENGVAESLALYDVGATPRVRAGMR